MTWSKMGEFAPSAVAPAPAEQAEPFALDPEGVKRVESYLRMIQGVYNLRPLNQEGVLAWVSVLGDCEPRLLGYVVRDWLKEENRAPKPSDLLREYQRRKRNQRQSHLAPAYLGGEEAYACPYCKDKKLLLIQSGGRDLYGEVEYGCSCRCDPGSGNLRRFLSDPTFEFDGGGVYGVFRRKRGWIGEEEGGK